MGESHLCFVAVDLIDHVVTGEQQVFKRTYTILGNREHKTTVVHLHPHTRNEPVNVVLPIRDSAKITVTQEIIHTIAVDLSGDQTLKDFLKARNTRLESRQPR